MSFIINIVALFTTPMILFIDCILLPSMEKAQEMANSVKQTISRYL